MGETGFSYNFGGGSGSPGGFPGHPGAPWGGPGNPYQPWNYPPGSIPNGNRETPLPIFQEAMSIASRFIMEVEIQAIDSRIREAIARNRPMRAPSPPLESVYPELSLLPAAHRLALPVVETIIEIGHRLDQYRDSLDYPRIETPDGEAIQDTGPEALAVRERVEAGSPLYRIGTREGTITRNGTPHPGSYTGEGAQFWAAEHPNTPGYADRYGVPLENITESNFIEIAVMRPNSSFITRVAPPVGANRGGGIEIVVPQTERAIEVRAHTSH